MPELGIQTYTAYESFATDWAAPDKETRMTWQLLEQIDDDEVLVELPQWLADENVGYTQGSVPTAFVGRIATESDEAIHPADSAAARSIRKLAYRTSQLEQNDSDEQDDWLDDRLAENTAKSSTNAMTPSRSTTNGSPNRPSSKSSNDRSDRLQAGATPHHDE